MLSMVGWTSLTFTRFLYALHTHCVQYFMSISIKMNLEFSKRKLSVVCSPESRIADGSQVNHRQQSARKAKHHTISSKQICKSVNVWV